MMLYLSVKFERNYYFPLKGIDWKPQIDNLAKIYASKKIHNSVKILWITPLFEHDLYLMMMTLA